jgi:broad specificity phosphatase PhoE
MSGRGFLLRHGETEWSATGRHTSHSDIALTEEGCEQAKTAGALLQRIRSRRDRPIALVLSSPMRRALETAALAGLLPEIDERLKEWDYGEFEGLTTPQIRETVPGWTVWTHPSPGGETAEQVAARADAVLRRARGALPDGDVVLVGHGHFSRVLAVRWIGLPATAGVHVAMGPAALTVLGDERGVPRLDNANLIAPS